MEYKFDGISPKDRMSGQSKRKSDKAYDTAHCGHNDHDSVNIISAEASVGVS